jgi:hypothetical protein
MKSEKCTPRQPAFFGRFVQMGILSVMLTLWYSGLTAQTTPSCPLACNNLVHVSMDEDCRVTITPDMMLEGQGVSPSCNYSVQVLKANGQQLETNPDVTSANVGQTLTVRVWLGANSCWGTIKIEDKLPPVIDCPAPVTVSCWDTSPFPLPDAYDNCSSVTISVLTDVTNELPCTDVNRARRTIRYQAKDASNNLSQICERVITYSRVTLANVKFPKSFDGAPGNRPHLECDGGWAWNLYKTAPAVPFPTNNWDLNGNYYPDPEETGAPYIQDPLNVRGYINGYKVGTGPSFNTSLPGCTSGNLVGYDIATASWQSSCGAFENQVQNFRIDTFYNPIMGSNNLCKINTTFSDTKIDICPKSFKVLRNWTVLDWCTGQIATKFQVIKVVDDEAPAVTCPADLTSSLTPNLVAGIVSADPYTCTGTWAVRPPITISDCNTTTWTVRIKLADQLGNDPGPSVPFVTQDGSARVTGTYPNFVLVGLPLGRTWVQYLVTDACGNVGECITEVDVFDRTPPIPVCDEFTVVTLSNNGWAHVFAETFDDGSHDNCTDVMFDVRRMDGGSFGPFVQFSCSDVGKEVMVELRVTDKFNNSNTCMVIVNTQDKVPPVITCPLSVTIGCEADTSATALGKPVYSATPLATPYFTDNCPNPRMSWRNTGTIDNCGQGVITRIFTVTDNGGRTATCSQTITIRNSNPYTGPVLKGSGPVWKNLEDREITGCMNVDTDPSKTGVPDLGATACSQVAYTYEDQLFPFVDNVCFKILRKWTVIDWCKFAPNRNPNGSLYPTAPTTGVNMWIYTQIIKVSDLQKPVLADCTKKEFDGFGDNCTGFAELKNSATDCTPAAQLKWTYTIDPNNDGIAPFINGTKNDASGTYPVGTHKITWRVSDMCGNESACEYEFVVKDKKKPTPYCISELTTVIMPSSGNISIWAKDFDKGSSDNCPGTLLFTFDGARPVASKLNQEHYFKGNGQDATKAEYEAGVAQLWRPADKSSAKFYTCADLGQNTENMSVWDASFNTDYCTVTLNVQANGTACSGSRLAGSVGTETNKMVQNVEVGLLNMLSNEARASMTNAGGYFEFMGMPQNDSYKITPQKDNDYLNGVSTLDLVLIQRHILGIQKLGTSYKHLAADVNKDNKITASDLLELRKLILGIYTKFPTNTSWRFMDKSVAIADIANPWNVNEYIHIDHFNASLVQNNFVAVKVGDVNDSASANAQDDQTEARNAKVLTLVVQEKTFQTGEYVTLDITAENFQNIMGAQWTLNFDASSLEFAGFNAGALNVTDDNLNAGLTSEGKLTFSWNDFNSVSVANGKILFTLKFKALASGSLSQTLKLSSDITKAEAYNEALSQLNLALTFRGAAADAIFALEQNNPNPFSANTTIGFVLPKAGEARLTVFDVTGKVLKMFTNSYPKGRSEIVLSAEELNAQGVMFYELESNGQKSTKKMIYLSK